MIVQKRLHNKINIKRRIPGFYTIYRGNIVMVVGLVLLVGAAIAGISIISSNGKAKAATSFTFTAAGDFGYSSSTSTTANRDKVFQKIGQTNANFMIGVGDFAYFNDSTKSETLWCDEAQHNINIGAGKATTDAFGYNYPFELIAGGHDAGIDHPLDGLIDDFALCMPDRMNSVISTNGSTANYGKEYYFDYPATAPIARFIQASPKTSFTNGGLYGYLKGDAHYNWLSAAIDDARAKQIKWVVVANHENYISTGIKTDEIGSDYFNLLLSKKVDLILQGHDHNYQRSKQLATNTSTCTTLSSTTYNAACVAGDGGTTDTYTKGLGSVLVINGTGGVSQYNTAFGTDAQSGFFKAVLPVNSGTGSAVSFGITKFTVTDTSITANYLQAAGSGTWSDNFTISSGTGPIDTTKPTVSLTNPTANSTVNGTINLAATAADDTGVTKVDFTVDGAIKNTDTSSPYSYSLDTTTLTNGTHTIAANAYDAAGNVGTSSVTVTVNNCASLPTTYGSASSSVNVTSTGTYHVWARVMAPDTTNNSFYFQSDNSCGVLMGDSSSISPNTWVWVDYRDGNSATKNDISYSTTGSHNIILTGNEPGVKLDRVLLLSETCVPTGTGDNCTTTPDITAPTASITSPATGATVSGTVNVAATATDNAGGSGVAKVDFSVDGVLKSSDTTSPYSFSWDSTGAAIGNHTISAKATDAAGNVSAVASITVKIADVAVPTTSITSPVTGATVNGTLNVSVTNSDNVGVTKVDLILDGTTTAGTISTAANPAVFNWNSTSVPNGSHTLQAKAYDAAGNVGSSSTISVTVKNDITPPTAPSNLTATAASATQVNLSWSASTDDIGVTGYRVQRNGVVIASLGAAVSYSDATVTSNTTYSYVVYAVDAAVHTSAASNTATVTTPVVPDITAPSSPTLSVSSTTSSMVSLSWTAATDTGGSGLAGYDILRNGTKIATVSSGVTTYGDATVTAGITYTYTIVAFDGSANRSAASNQVSATVPLPDITPPNTTITSGPASSTTATNASFTFTSTESGSSFECSVDANSFSSCTSPKSYSALAVGSHTFSVRAIDVAGNVDATPATQAWTITSGTKSGDVDGNSIVDITDLSYILSSYGQNTTQCITNAAFKCDLSTPPDNIVNIFDLSILLSGYGT
jgi:hypothetical protein